MTNEQLEKIEWELTELRHEIAREKRVTLSMLDKWVLNLDLIIKQIKKGKDNEK